MLLDLKKKNNLNSLFKVHESNVFLLFIFFLKKVFFYTGLNTIVPCNFSFGTFSHCTFKFQNRLVHLFLLVYFSQCNLLNPVMILILLNNVRSIPFC